MRQTLFRIPLDASLRLGGIEVAVFGAGLLLGLWCLAGLWLLAQHVRREGFQSLAQQWPHFVTWAIVAVLIVQAPALGRRFAPEGLPIFGYGFMLFVAFLGAVGFAAWRARRSPLPPWFPDRPTVPAEQHGELIQDLAIWAFVSGIVGARLFYCLQYAERVFAGKQGIELLLAAVNLPEGGIVLYGGILLGAAAYFIFCYRRNVLPLALADVITPSIFIGLGFGRIGCFLNGCCYGDPCSLPWAVTFPRNSVPFAALVGAGYLSPNAAGSLPLHPTQLYSSLNAFLLAGLTAAYFQHRTRHGEVFAVAWLVYPITRFIIEFLRADEPGQFGTALTISQWVSIGLFGTGLLFVYYLAKPSTARIEAPAAASA